MVIDMYGSHALWCSGINNIAHLQRKKRLTYAIISSIPYIMSRVLPDCTVVPFICNENGMPSSNDGNDVLSIHVPNAADPSNALAISHGAPCSRNRACKSRAVKSTPTVIAS